MTYEQYRELTRAMREAQRNFYAAPKGSAKRNEYYRLSRELEKQVDEELGRKDGQIPLFAGKGS